MMGQHSVEVLVGAKVRVTFQITAEETAAEYRKVVQECAKSIELKGFRKGKVPVSVLENKFGKEFRAQTFRELMNQCTEQALPEIEPKPLPYSQPYLCDPAGVQLIDTAIETFMETFRPGQPLEFAVAFETNPEIPVPTLEGEEFEKVKVVVSDEDINEAVEQLREQNSVMVERKGATGTDGDILSLRFALLAKGQTDLGDDATKLQGIVRLGEQDVHGFHDKVKTMQSDEIQILKNYHFPTEGVEEQLRGKSGDVWLKVISIRTRELPELDDEFAQDIDENYHTLSDLQEATRIQLEDNASRLCEDYGLVQIYRHWAESLDFTIPRTMIAYQTNGAIENIKKRLGGDERSLGMYLALQHDGDVQKGLNALEKESLQSLFVRLVREKLLQSKNWQLADVADEDIERELAEVAVGQGSTVEELKGDNEKQREHVKNYAAERILTSRLNKELLAELETKSSISLEMKLAELKDKVQLLEQNCQNAVYDKFSPFKAEGGLLTQAKI